MTALADPTRSRLLLALERNELTVNELRSILQLPQSTISRHLKMLAAEGWAEARASGTSRHYRLASETLDPASRRLWHIVRDEILHTSAAEHDARRTQAPPPPPGPAKPPPRNSPPPAPPTTTPAAPKPSWRNDQPDRSTSFRPPPANGTRCASSCLGGAPTSHCSDCSMSHGLLRTWVVERAPLRSRSRLSSSA